jgi:RHS repeat-associated protein
MNRDSSMSRHALARIALQLVAALAFGFFDVPVTYAANGQCVWEGGPGAGGGHLYCKAEDCAGQGGLAQCTKPEGAPSLPYTDGELGPDNWAYGVCDDTGVYLGHLRLWCEVGGGTWNSSTFECPGLAEGYLRGNQTQLDNEEMSITASDAWIARRFAHCAPPQVTDTNWGISIPNGMSLCTTGGTQYKAGILTRQVRRRVYDMGDPCNSFTITMVMYRDVKCPAGYKTRVVNGSPQCFKPVVDPCCLIGNPVSALDGVKRQEEVDYRPGGGTGLEFVRRYNSSGYYRPSVLVAPSVGPDGVTRASDYWRHNYERRIHPVSGNALIITIAERADGEFWNFDGAGREIDNRNRAASRLEALPSGGWKLTLGDRSQEIYDGQGRLQSLTSHEGQVTTLGYGGNGLLATVTGPFGHSLQLAYDVRFRLESVTLPGNSAIQYTYDRFGRLSTVTYPGGVSRQYGYGSAHGSWLLTGITDESSQPFSNYTYDSSGKVTVSEHAGGADRYAFAYGSGTTTVTDPAGASRALGFSVAAGIYKVTSSSAPGAGAGTTKASTFDANGNPLTRTDFNNNQTQYTFDPVRNLETSRTEAFGTPQARTITTDWHPTFRLPSQIDEPGRRTTFTYDAAGNVLTKTVTDLATSQTRTWTYTYNTRGQVLTADGPRSDVTDVTTYTYHECTYGAECGQVETITNAAGHVTTFSSYNAHGQPLTITDPNGAVTTLTYDLRQRLTSRDVGGEMTAFTYYPTGLAKRTTLPNNDYIEYKYDAAHRLTGIEDAEGNRISYTLNAAGSRTIENVYDPSQALARTRGWVYDTLNRVLSEVDASNNSIGYTYDTNGNVEGMVDQEFRPTTYAYDELNRLRFQLDPAEGLVEYAYNDRDELESVTDARSATTTYEYTGFGEVKKLISPDTGVTQYTRNASGDIQQSTDARNKTATYSYDALARVTQIAYSDQTIQFTYDQGLNGKGKLTQLTDASGTTQWTYTPHGRVATRQQQMGAVTLTASYGYNAAGELSQMTLPSSQAVGFSYANGRPSGVTVNGSTLLSNVLYAPFGPTRGWTWGNGTLAVREYDNDGRLTLLDSAGLSTYTFYPDGKIRSWTDESTSPLNSPSGLTEFAVDEDSNRLLSSQGVEVRSYTYDEAGNVTSDGTRSFTYNAAGRTVGASNGGVTASYSVNGIGQRVRKSVAGQVRYFFYDEAGRLVGEYDGAGALIQETVWLADIPVATVRPNGSGGVNLYYIHTDHLSTPRRISRPSDNVTLWRWDSDPFGTTAANEDPDGDSAVFQYNLRFPGQYFDDETGLHYNYMRDYDPAVGRYVESDPIGLKGGINTYAYVGGNPISATDPRGLAVWHITWGVGGGVGYYAVGASAYRLHFFDPIRVKRCSYTVYCFGLGVGLPEFGINSPVMRWDDGKGECSDCNDHGGFGIVSYASAIVGDGLSIGGWMTIPNGPTITGNLFNHDGGAFRIGTALTGCRFQLD